MSAPNSRRTEAARCACVASPLSRPSWAAATAATAPASFSTTSAGLDGPFEMPAGCDQIWLLMRFWCYAMSASVWHLTFQVLASSWLRCCCPGGRNHGAAHLQRAGQCFPQQASWRAASAARGPGLLVRGELRSKPKPQTIACARIEADKVVSVCIASWHCTQ